MKWRIYGIKNELKTKKKQQFLNGLFILALLVGSLVICLVLLGWMRLIFTRGMTQKK